MTKSLGYGALLTGLIALVPGTAGAHEAWLLSPEELVALSQEPVPALFKDPLAMLGIAVAAALAIAGAIVVDGRLRLAEARRFAPLSRYAAIYGQIPVRIGLALMLGLAAFGGLPRHGTAMWTEPVLFVPNMQLSLVSGWDWLVPVQAVIAIMLFTGLLTRVAALAVIALAGAGLYVFGLQFVAYAAHFAAPALVLVVFGGGRFALDTILVAGPDTDVLEPWHARIWDLILLLTGGTFAYLAVSVKMTQPTLLLAILDSGGVPLFGVPPVAAAMTMAWVELIAGLLLAIGVFVRPVALFLVGAFTFFAVTIGETPLFHANLYGLAMMLFVAGRPTPRPLRTKTRGLIVQGEIVG